MNKDNKPNIKAQHFGKSHEDLLRSFVEKSTDNKIVKLQEETNATLKKIVQSKRALNENIVGNDVRLKNTNGGEFGVIDELSKTDGIGQVKTVSNKDFMDIVVNKGNREDLSELNALMHNSKIKKGYVHYVNEDNPYIQKTIKFKYDFEKYSNDLSKVKRIQSFINKKSLNINEELKKVAPLSLEEFPSKYADLQELKSHSITQAGLKTNNPFLRNLKRENRGLIEGLGHGWFGKTRKLATAFGSPFRLGDFSQIATLSDGQLNDFFDNQAGIDIETTSLDASDRSVFQVSLKSGNKYESYFVKQNKDFRLSDQKFLSRTGLGTINSKGPIDFSKVQKLNDYEQKLKNVDPTFGGKVTAFVQEKQNIRRQIKKFKENATSNNQVIFGMNLNFENEHLNEFFDTDNPIKFSDDYWKSQKSFNQSEKSIVEAFYKGEKTKDQAFSELVSNQKGRLVNVLNNTQAGDLFDIKHIARTLNAVAQEKDLIPRTGSFGMGTNVERMTKIFLSDSEFHEANLDNKVQEILAKKYMKSIQEIQGNKPLSLETQLFIDDSKLNIKENYYDSYLKTMHSAKERGESIFQLSPKSKNQNSILFDVEGLDYEQEFERAKKDFLKSSGFDLKLQSNVPIESSLEIEKKQKVLKRVNNTSLVLGGLLLGASLTNMFTFSGSDEEANTIEGLGHGSPTQNARSSNTAFGSGFRTQDFHNQSSEDPEEIKWNQLAAMGLGGVTAAMVFKHQASKRRLSDVTYLGALDPKLTNEELLGRKNATGQDMMVAAIRRAEASLGGLPKAFGAGDIASFGLYDTAEFSVDLSTKKGLTYARYMDAILNRDLIKENIDEVVFKKGELFLKKNNKLEKVDGSFSLMKTVTDYNQSDKISSLAKSQLYANKISNTKDISQFPFLIIGGKGDWKKYGDFANAYLHETLSKVFKMLSDPLEGLREVFPDIDNNLNPKIKNILSKKYMPDIGLDGKELVDTVPGMLKKHASKLFTFGTLAYVGLGTLDWSAQQVAPDGTVIGDAGLVGLGAHAIRKTHETYARISDITGLTGFRDYIESKAPGMDGFQSTAGLTIAGAMFGALHGGAQDVALESASDSKYSQFLENNKNKTKIEGVTGKVFRGEYTNTGKKMRIGGLIGFGLSLPFTLAGLGADKSAGELEQEYSGEKEVAVKKGRFWESSFTPFEGGEIDYYRPNWYAKLMDDAKNKELDGENISPIGKLSRVITDPYWLEKRRYHDQPYPITGPDGSMLGIFGPAYEATLGRVLKPVATMHDSVTPDYLKDNTEYDAEALLRKQWNATLEFMGLRGFALGAIKEEVTGTKEIFRDPNEARSAKDIDSVVRDFYDLQIGGGLLTTEAIRRVFQSQQGFQQAQINASVDLNPLVNDMPSWMPGSDYYLNFKSGDPFMKIKDGYSRLPGTGFAQRHQELKELRPEDYPDIYKYKILSDVAYGSMEQRRVKGKLQNRKLTDHEQSIFDEVQKQVDEKKESEMLVRNPSMYDSFLGRYGATLSDFARSNPLETLLPISPAHKFLAPPDMEDYLEEQRFSKDYRSWSNPFSDFVMPTVSMTLNNLGLPGVDLNDDPDKIKNYFDKVDYVKYTNLAREAQMKGDLKLADYYTVMSQKTYTGKDLYSHPAEVSKALPEREKKIYNYFVKSDIETQRKMLNGVNPRYRDAYQAQIDRNLRDQISRDQSISKARRNRALKEIQNRQMDIQARRKSEVQDFKADMPSASWPGWSPGVNSSGIQRNYLENNARDYHDYTGRREYRESPLEAIAAKSVRIESSGMENYASHYSDLSKSGVENSLVVIRPGIDNNTRVNIEIDRTEERNQLLKEWEMIV